LPIFDGPRVHSACFSHQLEICLLGLGNSELVKSLLEIVEKGFAYRRRRDRCLSPRFLLETEIAERLSPCPTRAF
jgi:hypothetical protein